MTHLAFGGSSISSSSLAYALLDPSMPLDYRCHQQHHPIGCSLVDRAASLCLTAAQPIKSELILRIRRKTLSLAGIVAACSTLWWLCHWPSIMYHVIPSNALHSLRSFRQWSYSCLIVAVVRSDCIIIQHQPKRRRPLGPKDRWMNLIQIKFVLLLVLDQHDTRW